MTPRRRDREPVFYGWVIVASTFVMLTTSSGLGFYALTLYLRTLTDEGGFSVSSVSGATAVFFVVSGLSGMGIGRLIARRDPRPVIAVSTVLAAGALVALGRAGSLPQVYAAYACFGAGIAGCSLVPGSTLVTRWFHRRRSLALSLSSTGLSLGGILLTPLAAALIDHLGFRTASVWLAVTLLVGVIPVTALALRPDPASIGLRPDGDAPGPVGEPAARVTGTPYADAVGSRLFRRITLAWALALMAQVGSIAHLVSLVDERVDAATAALAVSVIASSSMAGRLAGGWLLTRVALRPAALGWMVVQTIGLTGFGVLDVRLGLLVCASLFGFSVGNLLLLQPVILADVFGVRDYARIFGTSQLVSTVAIASGPFLVGVLRDLTGGYTWAYLTMAVITVAAIAVVLASGPFRSPQASVLPLAARR